MRCLPINMQLCSAQNSALQVACLGDLQVIKREGFWGHRERVLPDMMAEGAAGNAADVAASGAVAPLGELEFVLDRRRRRRQGSQGGGSQAGPP
jgi:hypothetical protein